MATLTATFRRAVGDRGWGGANVTVSSRALFATALSGYPRNSLTLPTNNSGQWNGAGGIVIVAPDTGDDAVFYDVALPDSVTTVAVEVPAGTTAIDLKNVMAGGTAPVGGTVLITGTLTRPVGGKAWASEQVQFGLNAPFATSGGCYPLHSDNVPTDTSGRVNGVGGVKLAVPTGAPASYYALLPDESVISPILLDASMGEVDIADIVAGDYATWLPPLPAPSSLTLLPTGTTYNNVLMSWQDNSNSETGFEIQYSTDNVTWSTLTTTAANVTSYTHGAPTLGVARHYYRVKARMGAGGSGWATASISGLLLSLVARYGMEDAAGTTRTDTVGGNTLTAGASVPMGTGKLGNAARLNTTTYFQSTASTFVFALAPFTISLWMQVESLLNNHFSYLHVRDESAIKLGQYSDNNLYVTVNNFDWTFFGAMTAGTWYHVAFGWTGTQLFGYVNAGSKRVVTPSSTPSNPNGVYINSASFGWRLDELLYHRRELSVAELAVLYNNGNGRAYPFKEA